MFSELKAPGLVCAVISNAQVTHYAARGYSNLAMKTPCGVQQSFPIGSLSKSFGAAAILLLRDQGCLKLNQSPQDFIPGLSSFWSSTSLHQLLSMQSGLGADYGGSWAEQHLPLSNEELAERLALSVIAASAPGTSFLYSNFGYMMIGRIISEVSGKDARDFIFEHFIQPLGMSGTTWAPPAMNTITGYRSSDDRFEEEQPFSANNDGGVFGGLWSTVPDMAVWMNFLSSAYLEGYSLHDQVLSRASRLEMQRAVVLRPIAPPEGDKEPSPCGAYGYGLVNFQGKTEWTVGHGGAVPGFGAHMRWSPQTGISVFAVANLRYADLSSGCAKILDCASGAAQHRRSELHPLLAHRANQLLSLISNWDSDAANTLFAENFFIDYPQEYISKRFAELRSIRDGSSSISVGQLAGLSAKITFGKIDVITFTISTLEPGLIQEIEFGEINECHL
jgi:CubicO group peptidase (beta-lactamase class C family)